LISIGDQNKAARVLRILLGQSGHPHSQDEISHKTGLKKGEIVDAIAHLMESGVQIKEKDEEYWVASFPDSIVPAVILCGLNTRNIGHEIHSFKTVGSTNEVARRLAESGAEEGVLVISERQTKGRGRLGRIWHSPSGTGLYFSLILRPWMPLDRMPALSQVAALSVCRAIEKVGHLQAQIKWPNDCLLSGKKVAGILVELSAELDRINYAVLGIGINVNGCRDDFPAKLRTKATSVAIQTKTPCHRIDLLHQVLVDFEKSYNNFQRYGLRFIGPELVKRSSVLGKKVSVNLGKSKIAGTAIGIDANGALRVKVKDQVKPISAGEVSLR
jgi:BirA family biotin operon repressor/biotin-[acetyl-CoA-carboxylase] ligase